MDEENRQNIAHQEPTPRISGPQTADVAIDIPVDKLQPNPEQPRAHFDDLEHKWLTESIAKNGVLQPILVRPVQGNEFMIIAGERRYRAAKQAGLKSIPAVVVTETETRPLSKNDVKRLALIENIQRSELNDYELAVGVTEHLREQLGFASVEEVARFLRRMRNKTVRQSEAHIAEQVEAIFRELGRHWPSFTANQLTVFSLYPELQQQLRLGKLDLSKARALNRIEDAEVREHVMWNAIAQGWSTAILLREIADLDKVENRTMEGEQRRAEIATHMTSTRKAYVKRRRLLSDEELSTIEQLLKRIEEIVSLSEEENDDASLAA